MDLDESGDDRDEERTGAFHPLASPIPPESPPFCYKLSKRSVTGTRNAQPSSLNIWGLLGAVQAVTRALLFSSAGSICRK